MNNRQQLSKYEKEAACPYCGKKNYAYLGPLVYNIEDRSAEIEIECYDCGQCWIEHYILRLTKVELES